jgi:hypothetical protein
MGCGCGGSNSDDVAEFEVRLPNGEIKVLKGKVAAELAIAEAGGGSIVKKR